MYDPSIDPDDPDFIESLREQGLDEEQIEQAQNHLRFLRDMSPEQREAHEQQSNDVAMGMSLVPRFTDSRGLLAINFLARERGYNRVLDEEEIVKLDPEGYHILNPFMIHRHAQGEDVPAHMRCRAFLKLAERPVEDGAHETMLDVPMELFIQMPEALNDEEARVKFHDDVWRVILGGS